jgi:hypothetical protein
MKSADRPASSRHHPPFCRRCVAGNAGCSPDTRGRGRGRAGSGGVAASSSGRRRRRAWQRVRAGWWAAPGVAARAAGPDRHGPRRRGRRRPRDGLGRGGGGGGGGKRTRGRHAGAARVDSALFSWRVGERGRRVGGGGGRRGTLLCGVGAGLGAVSNPWRGGDAGPWGARAVAISRSEGRSPAPGRKAAVRCGRCSARPRPR